MISKLEIGGCSSTALSQACITSRRARTFKPTQTLRKQPHFVYSSKEKCGGETRLPKFNAPSAAGSPSAPGAPVAPGSAGRAGAVGAAGVVGAPDAPGTLHAPVRWACGVRQVGRLRGKHLVQAKVFPCAFNGLYLSGVLSHSSRVAPRWHRATCLPWRVIRPCFGRSCCSRHAWQIFTAIWRFHGHWRFVGFHDPFAGFTLCLGYLTHKRGVLRPRALYKLPVFGGLGPTLVVASWCFLLAPLRAIALNKAFKFCWSSPRRRQIAKGSLAHRRCRSCSEPSTLSGAT